MTIEGQAVISITPTLKEWGLAHFVSKEARLLFFVRKAVFKLAA
jgi:hypothetical protein